MSTKRNSFGGDDRQEPDVSLPAVLLELPNEPTLLADVRPLIKRLAAALGPVAPRASFVAGLRMGLAEQAAIITEATQAAERPTWLWVAAGVGCAIALTGAVYVGSRLRERWQTRGRIAAAQTAVP